MTFTNMLKALGLLNNGPAPEQCYNPNSTRGTPAPATSKVYNHPELSHDNVTSFVPHGHDISEGLTPPHANDNSCSIAGPNQPANSKSRTSTYANPQLPKNSGKGDKHKNIGEKHGKKKNGKKKSSRSSGDSFKVHGNTINGGKGDKVGVFDFGNKYSRGGKKRDEEEEDSTEEDSTEEETDSGTEDERD
ncbi:uncharacterized protein LOC110771155 [Prunus avium]|uniref:Uncharacterized protein LOC110771155 n=1 Tax=Prunus avium TaxID=42229 RepID=A0A6P5TVD0_PRUAV|nr:uncharacterized protein LOC110771155 [Prunus avium]